MRQFALILLSGCCLNEVAAADAQLLLVRATKADLTCDVPVLHGRLFAVPAGKDLGKVATIVGLELLTHVQELPYYSNQNKISAIPAGTYSATVRTAETKDWMKGKPDRAWRLELPTIRGEGKKRQYIQFHYGKDMSWSEGCVILTGSDTQHPLVCKSGEAANSPLEAVKAVRGYVESTTNNSADKITVRIVEWPDAL